MLEHLQSAIATLGFKGFVAMTIGLAAIAGFLLVAGTRLPKLLIILLAAAPSASLWTGAGEVLEKCDGLASCAPGLENIVAQGLIAPAQIVFILAVIFSPRGRRSPPPA